MMNVHMLKKAAAASFSLLHDEAASYGMSHMSLFDVTLVLLQKLSARSFLMPRINNVRS